MTPLSEMLESFEGRTNYPYKDSDGGLTCGVGHFFIASDAEELFPAITGGQLTALLQSPKGHPAEYYAPLTTCRLTDAQIDALKDSDLASAAQQLAALWPAYRTLPPGPADAALDCAFNLGATKWLREFPRMVSALALECWLEAAMESTRIGVQPERNNWTAEAILSAKENV